MRNAPQQWEDATIQIFHKKKDRSDRNSHRDFSLVAHSGKILQKLVAPCLSNYSVGKGILPEEQRGFRSA